MKNLRFFCSSPFFPSQIPPIITYFLIDSPINYLMIENDVKGNHNDKDINYVSFTLSSFML